MAKHFSGWYSWAIWPPPYTNKRWRALLYLPHNGSIQSMDKNHDLKRKTRSPLLLQNVKLFAYAMVNLQNEKRYCSSEKIEEHDAQCLIIKFLFSVWRGAKKRSHMTWPCGLAIEMPCPPIIDYREVQRPYPCLRAQLRHLKIMVSAVLPQTKYFIYKVSKKITTHYG